MKDRIRRRNGGRWLALLLCAVLLLGMCPLFGAIAASRNDNAGALTIKLAKDIYDQLDADAVVEVTLYKIGEAAPETAAGWRLYDGLTEFGIIEAKTSVELGSAVQKAAKAVVGKYSGMTKRLEKGELTFDGLTAGVYLGVMSKGPENLEVTPFVVTVPSRDPETKEMRYRYDVNMKASVMHEPDTTTETPDTTTETPGTTTETPGTTTETPGTTTETPGTTTETPGTTTETPGTTTETPGTTTETPGTTTETPETTTETPENTTETPETTTETPETTTEGPETTTEGPDTTTEGPDTTTEGPETTTEGPDTTTEGPDTTTEGPETTTKGPDTTTKGPETTTESPETTTESPETTTESPETTTESPKTTTETPPPRQTTPPEDTTEPPEESIEPPEGTPPPDTEYTVQKGYKVVSSDGKDITNDYDALAKEGISIPKGIWVQLYQDGKPYGDRQLLTDNGGWKYTFTNLPSGDGNGHVYRYTAKEVGDKNGWIPIPNGESNDNETKIVNTVFIGGEEEEKRQGGGEDGEQKKTIHDRVAETRTTGTPALELENVTDEEYEELMDFFGYNVPLWGALMGTGDEMPAWPWVFAGVGVVALILIPIVGMRRRRKRQ